MRHRIIAGAIAFGAVALTPIAATAQRGNRDLMCNLILRTEDGRFTYSSRPGLSVLDLTAPDGPIERSELPDNVSGFACIRTSQVPDINDIEVLQAGLSLSISGSARELRIMSLTLADGRVSYQMGVGAMNRSETRATEEVIRQMQARIDAAAPTP